MTSTLPPTPLPMPMDTPTREPQLHLGTLVAGGIFVLIGVSWLLELTDVIDVRWSMLLPATLVLVGATLMLGARHARTGGLVALGVVLLVAALLASMIGGMHDGFDGPVGGRSETPKTLAQLDEDYSVGAGSLRLDLTDIAPSEYDNVERIRADVAMGEMRVVVPDGVAVRLIADVGMGEVSLFGDNVSGVNVERTLESDGYDDAGAQLEIAADVGMGNLRIERD